MPPRTAERPLLADRYRVIERLGTGGMAAVYLAHDERLDRRVAVKRLHQSQDGDLDAQRFEREAKIGASLSHPNLVSIFDIGHEEESVLLVMEYVEGETLADLLAEGPLSEERAVEIVTGVAAALDHAHEAGIVHRDVKPGNVLLGRDGSVKLADLGIAKAIERTDITRTGTVLGTPAYMAPEQLDGGKLTPAVDIYALAVIAFEMFTGKRARPGRTPVEIAHHVVNEPAPDPRDTNRAISPAAARAIRAGMARDPHDRPRRAGELAARLRSRAPQTLRRPAAHIHSVAPGRGRMLAAGGLLAVALAALVVGLTSGGGGDAPRDEPAGKAQKGSEEKADNGDQPAPVPAAPAESQPAEESAAATSDPHALQQQGFEALQAGDYDAAIDLSRQAVESFPDGTTDIQYAYALFNLGKALRLAGRPEEAIPVLEQRLEIPNQRGTVRQELEAARRAADD